MEHTSFQYPESEVPYIDFSRYMIVAVFMGQKNTGGYSVEITEITKDKDEIIVKYIEKEPEKTKAVTQVLTQPYHIKLTEKTDLKVTFQKLD